MKNEFERHLPIICFIKGHDEQFYTACDGGQNLHKILFCDRCSKRLGVEPVDDCG